MLTTVVSFLFALAVLIAVHEYGHYRVAVACGVKVLRFSIGFGPVVWSWRSPRSGTEFALSAVPLGGYVRMLDEREAPVVASERHLAFNTQPLAARAAIVAAGPLANLLLAVLLYTVVAWWGQQESQAVLSKPVAGTLAEQAGIVGQERVLQAGTDPNDMQAIASFEELRWHLAQAVVEKQDVYLNLQAAGREQVRTVLLPVADLPNNSDDLLQAQKLGLLAPWSAPVMGEISSSGAAAQAGLQAGDRVLQVNGQQVVDALQLRLLIRAAVDAQGHSEAQEWLVQRQQSTLLVQVTPRPHPQDGSYIGRIEAMVGAEPAQVEVSYPGFSGVAHAVQRTWEMSALTLKMMGKMLLGQASYKNISGPLSIADFAGKSAQLGLVPFLLFLAVISVSLGVLNLLPVPILDGGHLMYYLWEGVTGRPVSDVWMERLQRGGMAVLLALMSLAIFNDVARLLG